jgi:hypothetical protein
LYLNKYNGSKRSCRIENPRSGVRTISKWLNITSVSHL